MKDEWWVVKVVGRGVPSAPNPEGMQTFWALVSGGRFPCRPKATTGYRLPNPAGWAGPRREMGKPHGSPRRHALIRA